MHKRIPYLRVLKFLCATFALLNLMFVPNAEACTSIQVNAADGSSVVARTLDFEVDMQAYVKLFPRGETIQTINPDGTPGLHFTTKYAHFDIMSNVSKFAGMDAMNEKGLVFGLQWLNASEIPSTLPADNKAPALEYEDVPRWILGQFATVDEVKANLDKVAIWAKPRTGIPGKILTVHVLLFDAQGKGLVIEFIEGKMHVYDNPVGVVTNDPTFDWQLENLSNYIQITGIDTHTKQYGDYKITVLNHGNGSGGIPGDMSSPSRFVRMVSQLNLTVQPANAKQAVTLAGHLINNVDLALGTVRDAAGPQATMDSTYWSSLRDTKNSIYYIRECSGLNFYKIDLKQLWNCNSIKELSLHSLQNTDRNDVTSLLKINPA